MTEIRVDWGDTDRADVVYYPNYFHYFNIAENELFRSTGRTRKALMEQYRIRFPRREVFCQFHRPALWDDLLEIHTVVQEVREKAYRLGFEVFRKGEPKPLATGRIVTVCLDLDSQQPRARKIPEEIVRLLRGDVRGH